MSDEDDNSFLLVAVEDDESQKKSIYTSINRDSSSLAKSNTNEEIIENTKKTSFCEKFLNKLLSLDKKNKNKQNEKYSIEDYFTFGFLFKKRRDNSRINSNSFGESTSFKDTSLLNQKKKSVIRNVIELKKENEWNEFIKEYRKEIKEKNNLKKLFKETFNINSDIIRIWKFIYALFYMIIFFFVLLSFIFFDLINKEPNEIPKRRFIYLYEITNLMFLTDLILSILILIANGGSIFSFVKIPIKIYLAIPFPLSKKYIIFLIPKFCRIDLFRKIFKNIEEIITKYITPYIQNYHLKIFILYINRLFSYMLEFGLYAHFSCCLYCYLDGVNYINGLFYTIEIITTIGYGEHSPKNIISMMLVMATVFIGCNFVIVINCNINFLTTKIRSFSRMTSDKKIFESLIFQIQSSAGKLFPKNLKESFYSFLKFHKRLSFQTIKSQNSQIFSLIKPKIKENILNSTLDFLLLEYKLYFSNCEKDFIISLFEVLKPKIYKENTTIIKYGQKVNKLYFLLNGILFGFDKNYINIFTINNNSIFCEYEFITGINSEYEIKTHPKIPSYGFTLKKRDWDIISKKYIYSSKKFIELSLERRKNYIKKLNKIYENNILNKDDLSENYYINKDKNIFEKIYKYQERVIKMENNFINIKQNLFESLNYK